VDCRSKGKTQFKIKVRSISDEETTKQIDELKKQIEEIKKDFPKGSE
jgi:multidrug efflux pump subunit AcrB